MPGTVAWRGVGLSQSITGTSASHRLGLGQWQCPSKSVKELGLQETGQLARLQLTSWPKYLYVSPVEKGNTKVTDTRIEIKSEINCDILSNKVDNILSYKADLKRFCCLSIGYSGDKQQNRFRSALLDKISQFIHISSACVYNNTERMGTRITASTGLWAINGQKYIDPHLPDKSFSLKTKKYFCIMMQKEFKYLFVLFLN